MERFEQQKLVGESENPRVYEMNDNLHYSDKLNHATRTLANEHDRKNGHKKHWKKLGISLLS